MKAAQFHEQLFLWHNVRILLNIQFSEGYFRNHKMFYNYYYV